MPACMHTDLDIFASRPAKAEAETKPAAGTTVVLSTDADAPLFRPLYYNSTLIDLL